MQQRVSPKERLLPDTTTVIGMLWVGATVYERLWTRTVPLDTPAIGWYATVITLIVAWSVMSRKRWARLALLGMAALTAASSVWSLSTCFALPGTSFLRNAVPPTLASAIPGEGEHSAVMAGVFLVIAIVTLGWLASTRVRSEFDARKVKALHAYQVGIAAALIVCWATSEVSANVWPTRALAAPAVVLRAPARLANAMAPFRVAWRLQDRSTMAN